MGTNSTIASRLRAAREQAGLSQGQAAKKLKVARPTISEIEAGRRKVSAQEVSAFAELYGVGVDWLASSKSDDHDPAYELAARELARLKPEDLTAVLNLLKTLKKGGGK
jgi:transcriptional regulator with XRE-family HTH domain